MSLLLFISSFSPSSTIISMKPFVLNGMFDSISPPFTEHLPYSIYFMLPSGKESAYWFLEGVSCRSHKGCRFDSWVGKILWSRKWQSTPVFLPEKSQGQKSLAGYNPWGRKKLDTNEWLSTLIHRQNKIIFKSKTMLPFTKEFTNQATENRPWYYCFNIQICIGCYCMSSMSRVFDETVTKTNKSACANGTYIR